MDSEENDASWRLERVFHPYDSRIREHSFGLLRACSVVFSINKVTKEKKVFVHLEEVDFCGSRRLYDLYAEGSSWEEALSNVLDHLESGNAPHTV